MTMSSPSVSLRRVRAVAQPIDEQVDHAPHMIGTDVMGGSAEAGDRS
jgi:hypothetical protein